MIKILIVDDERGVCDIIQKTFSYSGFTTFSATKAKKALSLLKKEKPKIVFLDILMPDTDGLDLLKQMKEIDPGVIVIMVTAKHDEATQRKALESGADEFVKKPFSHNYLRDVVIEKIKDVLDKGGHMQKPRILIVDDEDGVRENLRDYILPRFDCDIEEANDGESTISKVKEIHPDLILLDIKMPKTKGLDLIEDIKQLSSDIKIIVISAWKSSEVVNKAITMGASDYIAKPISMSLLGEKLKSHQISIGKYKVKKI